MNRVASFVALTSVLIAVGCGGGGSSSGSGSNQTSSNAMIAGNWQALFTSTAAPGQTGIASGFFTQSGSSISGNILLTGQCASSGPISGSVNGSNVNLTLNENGQSVTLTGTVSSGNQTMSGTYQAASGGCTNGDKGSWSASLVQPLNGSLSGSFTSSIDGTVVSVSGTISEAANSGASTATLSGSANLINSACFSSAVLSGAISGTTVVIFVSSPDNSQQAEFDAISNDSATSLSGQYTVTQGACAGDIGFGSVAVSQSSPPPPPPPISVGISPPLATVNTGASVQFSASVSGTSNQGVTWEVNGLIGGNSTIGTITTSGNYTAPLVVPNPPNVTVTAVSQADTSKSASAPVTINSGSGGSITVTVSPGSATVAAGSTKQFNATVTNTNNPTVIWEVNGIFGGNSTVGTIDSSGIYVAPPSPPAAGTVTVQAVSQADTSKVGTAIVTPTFSTASLSGTYVFKAVVTDASGFTFAGGVFTADGHGNLTNGIEDLNDSITGVSTGIPFSGSYNVGADGRGSATASSTFGTSSYRFVLTSSASGQLIEFDSAATSAGFILAQDQSAIATLSGTFVFSLQGADLGFVPAAPLASVGQVQLDGFGNTSGVEDVNDGGGVSTGVPFTGSYSVGGQGRGTAAFSSAFGSSNYIFYIVDAKTVEFLNIDSSGLVETGVARLQSAGPFTNASLGSSAFLVSGSDLTSSSAYVAAGRFDTNAAGNLLNGVLNENDNGSFSDGIPFSGSYAISSTGRGTATAITQFGTSQFIFWIVSPGNAFFMESDSLASAVGVALGQQGPFSNSTLQGNYDFFLGGDSNGLPFADIGQIAVNGAGSLTGTEDFNVGGTLGSGISLTGTYSIGANGQGTALVTGASSLPVRIDMISPFEGVFISADPSQPVTGLVEKQCSDCH